VVKGEELFEQALRANYDLYSPRNLAAADVMEQANALYTRTYGLKSTADNMSPPTKRRRLSAVSQAVVVLTPPTTTNSAAAKSGHSSALKKAAERSETNARKAAADADRERQKRSVVEAELGELQGLTKIAVQKQRTAERLQQCQQEELDTARAVIASQQKQLSAPCPPCYANYHQSTRIND
jgi:hypothetical protein